MGMPGTGYQIVLRGEKYATQYAPQWPRRANYMRFTGKCSLILVLGALVAAAHAEEPNWTTSASSSPKVIASSSPRTSIASPASPLATLARPIALSAGGSPLAHTATHIDSEIQTASFSNAAPQANPVF